MNAGADRGEERVVVHQLGERIDRGADEARVDAAGDHAVGPLQLLQELRVAHAQVGLQPVVGAGAGVARELGGHAALLLGRDHVALHQRRHVLAVGEALHLVHERADRAALFGIASWYQAVAASVGR